MTPGRKRLRACRSIDLQALFAGILTLAVPIGISAQTTFSNPLAVTVPAGAPSTTAGPATPYPSNIPVAGLPGVISDLRVTLHTVVHPVANHLDVLLVGPGGQRLILMSDVGGTTSTGKSTYVFRTGGPVMSPVTANLSGQYAPTNFGPPDDTFPAPAPPPGLDVVDLAGYNGTDPNGTWSLYVVDDTTGSVGTFAGGWSLTISTTATPPHVVSINRASPNPTPGTPVDYVVTFSDPVTGVDASDFAYAAIGTPNSGTVGTPTGGGTTWTVPITGLSGYGNFQLRFVDNDTVVGPTLIPVGGPGPSNGDFVNGQVYTLRRSNDLCDNAIEVFPGDPVPVGNNFATLDGDADCGDSPAVTPDTWYSFTPVVCGYTTVDTCSFATFDTVLSVQTDCSEDPVILACSDDAEECGPFALTSAVSFYAEAGETYLIRLSGFSFSTGEAILNLDQWADEPFVVAFSADPPAMYNVGPGTAQVAFSQPVVDVGDEDFDYVATGTAAAASHSVTGSGDTYSISYNDLTGDGLLTPIIVDGASILSGCDNLATFDSEGDFFCSNDILVDNTDPDGGGAVYEGPGCVGESTFTVNYFDAFDPIAGGVASGLASTELWYSFDGGPWVASGFTSTNPTGSFNFTFVDGPGEYQFAMVGTDNVGNVEAEPVGEGDFSVSYDDTVTEAVCQNIEVFLNGGGFAFITPGEIDNGSTGNCGIQNLEVNPSTFDCSDVFGPVEVTLTVTDAHGVQDTCTANVTVTDDQDPFIAFCGIPQSVPADGECSAILPDLTIGVPAFDNCGTPTLTQSPEAGSIVPLGTTTVTITATDPSGNTDTCDIDFTVVDETDPTFDNCADDDSASADANCEALVPDFTGGASASDNCDESVTITQDPAAGTTVTTGSHTITLTATDDAGNFTTCEATFTVTDDTDPVITDCADDDSASADANCEALVPDFTSGVSATDNCDESVTITQDPAAGTTVTTGVHTITLTATDDSGNTDTCEATFTVTDDTDPSFDECAEDQEASADANCEALVPDFTGDASASDNCDESVTITQDPAAGTTVTTGSHTITLTATDDAGNFTTCEATFTVTDDTDPVIEECAEDQEASAGGGAFGRLAGERATVCQAPVPDFTFDVTASDNCDESLTITQSPEAGTMVGLGDHTITITVTDDAGNTDTCEATFTVTDDTNPVITGCAGDDSTSADANCEALVPDFTSEVTATDNCDGFVEITQDPAAGTTVTTGVHTITLTATDDAGNTDTCEATFTVTDDTDPSFDECAEDQEASADANCEALVPDFTGDASASDNCDESVTITQDPAAGSTVTTGAHTITLTATDDAGNFTTCEATFTVTDDTDPVITDCADDDSASADANCEALVPDFTPEVTATDNCDESVTITQDPAAGTPVTTGSHTITITATDDAGNTDTCEATFTVTDDTDPSFDECAPDQEASADANCEALVPDFTGNASASDNCDESVTITQDPAAGTTVTTGSHTITLTATDDAGNTDTCEATFTVTDDTDPVITDCADDDSASADANCEALVPDFTSGVSATDNCDESVTITQDPAAGTTVTTGVHTITLTATDDAGNTDTCEATFTVTDDTDPVIEVCAEDDSASADANCEALVPDFTSGVSATDNCDESITITQDPAAGTTVTTGVHTITLTATDDAGNTDTCEATFTVTDETDPVITTCADDDSASADANCEALVPDFTSGVSATDNCDESVTITQDPAAGTTVTTGSHTITLTATDDAGNFTTCEATFTVTDDTDPVITDCADDDSASADENCEALVPDFTSGVSATDNCDESVTITQDPAAGTTVTTGAHTITLTATDDAGNTDTCEATFTVTDDTDPVITACAGDDSASADANCEALVPDFTLEVAASDNCDESVTITQDPAAGTTVTTGVHTITLTATDDAGNTDTCEATFTVTDDTDPVITDCADDDSASADANCEALVPDFTSGVSATDNCDESVTITQDPAAGTTVTTGSHTITITATDDAGNTDTCEATFTVTDDTDPVIEVCAEDDSASADANCEALVPDFTSGVTATDNCDESVTITQDPAAGTTVTTGLHTITLTATDDAGNTDTCEATFTVTDETDPTFDNCADDDSASADANCEALVPDFTGGASASDNCDESVTITQDPAAGTTVTTGSHTITLTATDDAGNFTTCEATFTVTDDTDPVITDCADDDSAVADSNCEALVPDFTSGVSATDNCDESVTITQDPAAGTTVTTGAHTITLTATDDAGNTDTCEATFTVTDETDPTFDNCADDQEASADANCEALVPDFTGDASASDNCDESVTITQDPAAGTTVTTGVHTITLTATDDAGNFTTCEATFTVTDDTDPSFDECAEDQEASADANCEALVPDFTGDASASDNCDESVTITQDPAAGTTVTTGSHTITLTATDDAGNFTTCEATFTVTDDTDPVIEVCAEDDSASADANCEALVPDFTSGVSATDNCDESVTITQDPAAGTTVTTGSHTITLTATDDAGNTDTCEATFTVTDDTDPVITGCAGDDSTAADANCEALVPDFTLEVTASDNCDESVTITQDPAAGTTVTTGVHTITITATDDAGNTDTCEATFTVTDETDPVITTCADDDSASADANCEALVPDFTSGVSATDNCDESVTITQDPAAGTTVTTGSHTITLTATDDAGNFTTCEATFTVTDDTDPVITDCADDDSASADENCEALVPDFTSGVSATDNCDESVTITQDPAAGTTVTTGVHTITLTATDDAGNTDTCEATFTVTDDTDPSFDECAPDQEASADANCEALVPDFTGNASASDNCDESVTITQDPAAGTTVTTGSHTITLTATDDAGNFTTCEATFTVTDDTDPVIEECADDDSASADANCEALVPDFTSGVSATDNCDESVTITQDPAAGTTVTTGSHTITLTATDDAGNTDTCTATFTVTDDTDPVIEVCAEDDSASADANCEALVPDFTAGVTATDNCDESVTITQDPAAGTTVTTGVHTITLTATDDAGNTDTCEATFTVTDETDPTFDNCADDDSASADANCEALVPDFTGGASASDNCDESVTITQDPAAGTTVTTGSHTITLTATDDAGNFTTCEATFTVTDDTDPVITDCADDDSAVADSNCEALVPDFTSGVSATDNCDESVTITQDPAAGTTVTTGAHTITLTATDDAGNTDTCEATFTVTDETDPTFDNCADDQEASADANCEALVPDFTGDASASDNCDESVTITQDPAAGTTVTTGVHTITLTATDDAGNFTTCEATFTVTDDTDPEITVCADDDSADADENCEALVPDFTSGVSATDNCDESVTITQDPAAGTTVTTGAHTITLTAADDAGNFTTCEATFTVTDDIDPVITVCADDDSAAADANCEAPVPDFTGDVTATDNCDESVTITQEPTAGTLVGIGETTVTLTATDLSGNTDTCEVTFTVTDETDPVITGCAGDDSTSADANCEALVPDFTLEVTASDNCDTSVTITQDPAAGTVVGVGSHTITITATDDAGNTDTCEATFDVTDDTDPVITNCADDDSASADLNCEALVPDFTAGVTATDNCDQSVTITQSPVAGSTAGLGANTITIIATDDAGNTDTCEATFTVTDDTDPVITVCPDEQNISADSNCEAQLPDLTGDLFATDNCDMSLTVDQDPAPGTTVGSGPHSITLTVTDDAGNSDSCITTVTVIDSTPPTALCRSIDVCLDPDGFVTITPEQIDNGSTDNCGIESLSLDVDTFDCSDVGIPQTVTLTVTDFAGNQGTCQALVNVDSCVLAICRNIEVCLDSNGNATITPQDVDDGSLNPCGGSVSLSIDVDTFDCADAAATLDGNPPVVTLTVTDSSLNSSTCEATVTVLDCQDPVITNCIGDFETTCNTIGGFNLSYTPIVVDNCSTTFTQDPPNPIPYGVNVVTITVTDASGNTDECVFTATVIPDRVDPVRAFSVPAEDGFVRTDGLTDSASGTIEVGDGPLNFMRRGLISFDTSTVPLDAIITSVNIRLTQAAYVRDTDEPRVAVVGHGRANRNNEFDRIDRLR
jgi:beta-lactam-binding protein with PASTA domain